MLMDNGDVQGYAKPTQKLPPETAQAIEMLAVTPARGAIIYYLAKSPEGSLIGEIVAGTGVPTQTTYRHLKDLEQLGLVVTDSGKERTGQRVKYSLDSGVAENALTGLKILLKTTPVEPTKEN